MSRSTWDSLKAHNGCLALFDIKDLSQQIRALSLHQQQEQAPSARPRQYRFRRMDPAELVRHQEERRQAASAERASGGQGGGGGMRRLLLPAVQTEDIQTVGADIAACSSKGGGCMLGGDGVVVFVNDTAKVRVWRDTRTKADLLAAFPDVDAVIVEEVWARTQHLFAAASPILQSLRNSGHVELAHHLNMDLRLDDPCVWPSIEQVFGSGVAPAPASTDGDAASASAAGSQHTSGAASEGSVGSGGGWEQVALPEGEHWVLIEEEAGGAPALTVADVAALAFGKEEEEEEGEAEEGDEMTAAPTGAGKMDYRKALTSNLVDGDEGAAAALPAARRFFPSSAAAAVRRKRAKVAAAEEDDGEGGGGNGWHEEYLLAKAVSIRTRKHCGRKRLTETGKARMAAKQAKRQQQAAAAGSGSESEGDAMEW